MVEFRAARDVDVVQIRDLFVEVYGHEYPYEDFYDLEWLKKAVYDDDVLFLVAEADGEVVATCSAVLTIGELDDLVAELGRLVASPTKRVAGAASGLVRALHEQIHNRIQFAFAETRTVHPIAQHIFHKQGYQPVGFEPLKYNLGGSRESVAILAHLSPMARDLRRNHPQVIPEVAGLARTALRNLVLPDDILVKDEVEGYPLDRTFQVERLQEHGVTPLLRIERGRISNREIFGNASLAHGWFHMANTGTEYLVARNGDDILGAIGFTVDAIDNKLRIFELIEFDDTVKGFLLAAVDRFARDEYKVAYQEVDVSAYAPKIQRTLERLGYVAVAYCPSMVFENVERLDIVRMVKLTAPYAAGSMELLEPVAHLYNQVEQGLENRRASFEIAAAAQLITLLRDLPDDELYYLARVARLQRYVAGDVLARAGDSCTSLIAVVEGALTLQGEDQEGQTEQTLMGRCDAGDCVGEMALLSPNQHIADIIAQRDTLVIELDCQQLTQLCKDRPRIGYVVMSNLARQLANSVTNG